jgi:phosphatidylethanolamine-binding protein (PEBP) family uncharacterized protein
MRYAFLFPCLLAIACSQQSNAAKPVVLAADRPETQASATFTFSSRDFAQGGELPVKYSDYGDGMSPSLSWLGLPPGTKTLAIMMEDPDAAGGLSRGSVTFGARMGRNGRGYPSYFGPRPSGKTAHHYHFQAFALDSELPLKQGASREQLLAAMKGHVLAKADLVGLFAQPKGR